MKKQISILESMLKKAEFLIPVEIESDTFLPSQGKTGYCWLMATLLCLAKRLDVDMQDISIEYLIYHDKREKTEHFLDLIIEYLHEPLDSVNNKYLLNNPMTDKGQWGMAVNLIRKYGLVSNVNQNSTNVPSGTGELNACISYILRCYAKNIRDVYESGGNYDDLQLIKEKVLSVVDELLLECYGSQMDKLGQGNVESHCSQKSVDLRMGHYFDDYLSICCNEKMPLGMYCIDLDGNVSGGEANKFLNLPEDVFCHLINLQIENESFCWFTADAGKFHIKNWRLFDDKIFDLTKITGKDNFSGFNRSDIWNYHIGSMAHTMVFLSKPAIGQSYYRVYDSNASEKKGGICYMSESWFNKYVLQAVVNRKLLPEQFRGNIEERAVKPWEFFPVVP